MGISIASSTAVSAAVGATQAKGAGEQQTVLLRKALNHQSQAASALIDSLPQQPPLSQSGSLGTRLNAYA